MQNTKMGILKYNFFRQHFQWRTPISIISFARSYSIESQIQNLSSSANAYMYIIPVRRVNQWFNSHCTEQNQAILLPALPWTSAPNTMQYHTIPYNYNTGQFDEEYWSPIYGHHFCNWSTVVLLHCTEYYNTQILLWIYYRFFSMMCFLQKCK